MQRTKAQTEQELDLINKMISRKMDEIEKLNEQEISLITAIDDSIKEIKELNRAISETINFKYKHEYGRNDVLDFYSEFIINPDGTIYPGGYMEADWDRLNTSPAGGAMAEALYQAYKKIKLFIPDITEYSTYANEMPYELK